MNEGETPLALLGIRIEWIEMLGAGLAAVANIVIAGVVAWLALGANKLNRESPFVQKVITELYDVGVNARELRGLYATLFMRFQDVGAKQQARMSWVAQKEAIDQKLYDLVAMFPELEPAKVAFTELSSIEDTHINTEVLEVKEESRVTAMKQYDKAHREFIDKLAELMKTIRFDPRGSASRG